MHCLKKLRHISLYKILFILLIAFVYATIYAINYKSKFSNETKIYGYIDNYSIEDGKLTIELNSKEKIICIYYFKDIKEINKLKLGDYIKLDGNLKPIKISTNFNTFDYKEYLQHNKINYYFNVTNIKKIKNNNKYMYKLKNFIIDRINEDDNKDYLYTFILGEKKYISKNVLESYKTNGISHLFAISGMHISLITLLIYKIFNKSKYKEMIVAIIILIYIFLANFSPSIMRAGIFFFLLILNKKLKLEISNVYLMLILLSICIFIDPFIIYKIGFQYSYLISFTLILFKDIINITNNKLKKAFIISIISFLASLPITANNFYQVNLLSIILNIIYIPYVSTIVFPLTILDFFIPIPILKYVLLILEKSSVYFSQIKMFIIPLSKLNIIFLIIYYIIIFYSLYQIRLKKYYGFLLLMIIFLIHFLIPYFDASSKIVFFDVEQGDSSFIKLPNNKGCIVIDTGGNILKKDKSYIASNIIINYIKSIGMNKINYLILTHGDFDHMGEAINLVNNFKVEKVIFNCGPYNDLEKNLIKVLDKKKIKYYSCIKELNIDNSKLYFLQTKKYDNENDNSNVIYTELDGYKFMFMGDASRTTEKEILDKYNLPDIDVLKVGHHGSKTSSSKTFINEINPKYSVISVGKNNRYGHPNKEVLENLNNSKIYRTDQDGSIMFKIKNNKLKINIFN
ncbi:MAG: DNA internalization-related competence protein ComEC/Rec2 [Bacilli bacterium]|nr:DNA internalization-related competence protein ComEC/Rec2 [Bacilli bacterium]